ncbi:MAG: DUF1801 domain-containing protein [Pyrinomonadaceae bacterium]
MHSNARSPEEYVETLPADRQGVIAAMRDAINRAIPRDFEEVISYGMLGWVVPHEVYPAGYHCDSNLPVPFLSLASQKNYISLYHMGLYGDSRLLAWFKEEWPKHSSKKLDMGKACVRFKNPDDVPIALIGELAAQITVAECIDVYERYIKP